MIPPALLACAPNVAPATLEAVISVESGGNPFAVHINGLHQQLPSPRDVKEAAKIAEQYIARGYSVDLGLMQVNSRNLSVLGVTIEQVLDPCTNIRSGSKILTADYAEAARTRGEGQLALEAALSAYNTGDFYRGFVNGYVARYYGPGVVPALGVVVPEARAMVPAPHRTVASASSPYTANTSVFGRELMNVRID
jgi:type IV secretion system protein VirB1